MSQFAVANRVFPTQQVFNTCSWIIDSEISWNSCISTQVTNKHNSCVLLVPYFLYYIQPAMHSFSGRNATVSIMQYSKSCVTERTFVVLKIWKPMSQKLIHTNWSSCGFLGGSAVKNPPAGDVDSIPGSWRSPRERKGNPLQYSCLRNPMGRGAWWATVHGVAKSRTQLRK